MGLVDFEIESEEELAEPVQDDDEPENSTKATGRKGNTHKGRTLFQTT